MHLREPEASHEHSQARRSKNQLMPTVPTRAQQLQISSATQKGKLSPPPEVFTAGKTTSATQLTSHPGALSLLQSAPPTLAHAKQTPGHPCFPQQIKTADSEREDPSGKQTL